MKRSKHVWITWERQTRNRSMAKILDAFYREFEHKQGILRYLVLSLKTFMFLLKNRPEIVYFQNPSVVLGLVCVLYRALFWRVKLVGDYHNCALDESSFMFHINAFIARCCALVIVTNPSLERIVAKMGGESISFPDPLPEVTPVDVCSSRTKNEIIFITSWANDEPINEVLDAYVAVGLNGEGFPLLVTGRPNFGKLRLSKEYYELQGVKFLGFVDEAYYWELLRHAYFVIDLTTRENCMVCGAYEALAVHRVLLLSDNQASVDYFGTGVTYTDNTQSDIQEKFLFIRRNIASLGVQVNNTVFSLLEKQQRNTKKIKDFINRDGRTVN